jgi:AcrR family transcriptional regulator
MVLHDRGRADRILDAAAELLQRWGYRRLTMDDVASQAGVGKGTVYLHWRTREALFQAVLNREILQLLGELIQAVQQDPRKALPDRVGALYFEATMQRPLVRAVLKMDREVLGNLVHAEPERELALGQLRVDLMRSFQELGVLRSDMSAEEMSYVFRSMLSGFLLADPIFGDEVHSLERKAELVSVTLRGALGLESDPAEAVVAAVAERVLTLLNEMRASGAQLLAQLTR